MLAVLLLNRMSTKRRISRAQMSMKLDKIDRRSSEDVCCRTCLNTEDLVPIFYSKESVEKRSRDLRLVTGLEIRRKDGLSQKICTQCIEKMNSALQFRRTSKKAEKSLINIVSRFKPKNKNCTGLEKLVLKSTRVKKPKVEEVDMDYEYNNVYGDDFQQDDYVLTRDNKPKIKLKPITKQKRMSIPNAVSYKCSTCNKEFRMKATYKAHMRFHTNYCVCETCGKRCRNNNQLQEHKRARHGLGRIHKCAYCEYSSATKEALTIHERRHTGERPYVCDHCGATFHRRSNLVQHIAIHLPEKNFQCTICHKWEKSKKRLQVHQSNVHREKRYRYQCPLCGDIFKRAWNVRLHLSRSHSLRREDQGVIEKCPIPAHQPCVPATSGPTTVTTDKSVLDGHLEFIVVLYWPFVSRSCQRFGIANENRRVYLYMIYIQYTWSVVDCR